MIVFCSSSTTETLEAGRSISQHLRPNDIVALEGSLGAGKTTLSKGIIGALLMNEDLLVNSPTFNYLHIYEYSTPVFHFDLYRLKGAAEFINLGFLDYFDQQGICLIEWAEKIEPLLPKSVKRIAISMINSHEREISYL